MQLQENLIKEQKKKIPVTKNKINPQKELPPKKLSLNTLNESISKSILRDINQISKKIKLVIIPFGSKKNKIKNWDLWGPLILCILLAYTLSYKNPKNEANTIFGAVFCLIWIGAGIVTLNAKLLKGEISFFHCVCTLGYSLFPMNLSALFCVFFDDIFEFEIYFLVCVLSLFWSCKSAARYLDGLLWEDTRGISLYPVFLFYSFLFFFILQMTQG